MIKLPALSIRARLLVSLSVVCVCLAATAAWSQWSARRNIETTAALFDRANAATQQGLSLRASVGELRRLESAVIAVGASNAGEVQRLRGLWKNEAASLAAAAGKLGTDGTGGAALAALGKELHATLAAYQAGIDPILQQLQDAAIEGPAALAYADQHAGKVRALVETTAAVVKAKEAALASIRTEMATVAMRQSQLQLALIGLTLAIFVPLMLVTLRSILQPLQQAVAAARRIASGDLGGSDIAPRSPHDEIGQLLLALSEMQRSLGHLVGQVRSSAESIHVASAEVATGNQDLSQRTERTASSLQQAASSMDQLAGTVGDSVDAARQASQLAIGAAEVATRGGKVVAEVVATMGEINQSSRRIADISAVIDGIAFQTNILALNAAVEAARAGEQGRGFAVVAGEVRSLAQRSAEAAKEIKNLIDASASRVERGAALVSNAGRTMDEIVGSVQRVSSMIGDISSAAGVQSGGIGEVSSSVAALDQMTQQNAALVEQSAAAAESLAQQASTLTRLVAAFRLDGAAVQHAPATPG